MKRVLITGASGFVGSNLARRMLSDGHEVHLVLRPSYERWRLNEIASQVRIHEAAVEDAGRVRAVVGAVRPDWVFHLAAYGAYSSQQGMDRMVAVNVTGCVSLLDACAEYGVESFVQTGSSSEYGYQDHAAVETDLLQPNSHYAVTKAAATHYAQFTARSHDINAVTLRLYSVYGSYEEPARLVPTLIVYGLDGKLPPLVDPRTARDFVHVDDAVDALITVAAARSIPRGSVYNVATGVQTTIAEIVAIGRRLMGIRAEPVWSSMARRSWDTDVWVGSPEKLAKEVGWRKRVGLEEGLGRSVEWMRARPERLGFYRSRVLGGRSL